MENENPSPVYALAKEHEFIAPAIYTGAGICSPDELVGLENLSPDVVGFVGRKRFGTRALPNPVFLTAWQKN